MEDLNFAEETETNENIIINETNENIIIDKNINSSTIEQIMDLLGLNINIDYPIRIILNGLVEMHTIDDSKNNGKYARKLMFRNDAISQKIKVLLFGNNMNTMVSIIHVSRYLTRAYRNHKYNKIINITDAKSQIKNDVIGFSNDDPRWVPLESFYLS